MTLVAPASHVITQPASLEKASAMPQEAPIGAPEHRRGREGGSVPASMMAADVPIWPPSLTRPGPADSRLVGELRGAPPLTSSVSFIRAVEIGLVGAKTASACGVRDGVCDLFVAVAHLRDRDPDVG